MHKGSPRTFEVRYQRSSQLINVRLLPPLGFRASKGGLGAVSHGVEPHAPYVLNDCSTQGWTMQLRYCR